MSVYYDHQEDAFYLDGFKDGYETVKGDGSVEFICRMLNHEIEIKIIAEVMKVPLTYVKAIREEIRRNKLQNRFL